MTDSNHYSDAHDERRPNERTLVGQELRRRREVLGIPQGIVANRIGKSVATISKIEAGQQGVDVDTLSEICRALDVSPYEVLLKVQLNRTEKPRYKEVLEVFRKLLDAMKVE